MEITMKHQILEGIKDKKISPEVGLELLKNIPTPQKESKRTFGKYTGEEIVVVGMSGQFPGAENVNELWEVIRDGKCAVSELPKKRWNWDMWVEQNDSLKEIPESMLRGGFLKNLSGFDASFFELSKNEAKYMDPCQRLFLQESWKALEDAGYSDNSLYGKSCGVFVGCQDTDYLKYYDGAVTPYLSTGSSKSVLASRVSYYLNLKGPAVSIDTACSSTLSALHIACQSIKDHSCDMALVGGVLTLSTPAMFTGLASLNMFSSKGCCRPFDQDAEGTVIGEAVGVVVLKKLKDVKRDGNHIYGIIRQSGWNQDGKTSGITAPSAVSQTDLETRVYESANINPETISYIEAHGTGTKLGDPIEIQALTEAFRKFTNKKGFCAVGSVKANIGHTMPAAGIASLIKVLLCLQNKKLVPSANFEKENSLIAFEPSPFYINRKLKDWQSVEGLPRRAAISSFGFSGTNCHVIVDEYIEEESEKEIQVHSEVDSSYYLLPFSAKSRKALLIKERNMQKWLEQNMEKYSIEEIESTLCNGRSHMKYRFCCVARSKEEFLSILKNHQDGTSSQGYFDENNLVYSKLLDPFAKDFEQSAIEFVMTGEVKNKEVNKRARRIINLPTYPFILEDYWIYDTNSYPDTIGDKEQTLEIPIHADEYFATNHIVHGNRIIPGAMQIVFAMKAAEKLWNRKVTKLANVVWTKPIQITNATTLELSLKKENTEICYQLKHEDVVSQGEVGFNQEDTIRKGFNLEKIKQEAFKVLSQEECYEYFESRGLTYKDGFHSIVTLYASKTEALAKLENPEFVMKEEQYVLCTVIDAAFQTVMGIMEDGIQKEKNVKVPFFLEQLNVRCLPTKNCYVYAKISDNNQGSKLTKYDLYVMNEDGQIAIDIKNFSLKPLARQAEQEQEQFSDENGELLYLKCAWKESHALEIVDHTEEKILFLFNQIQDITKIKEQAVQLSMNCDCMMFKDAISTFGSNNYDTVIFVNRTSTFEGTLDETRKAVNYIFKPTFMMIQKILQTKKRCKIIYHIIGSKEKSNPVLFAMDGLIHTLNTESRKSSMKMVLWSTEQLPSCKELFMETQNMQESYVNYIGGKRYVKVLSNLEMVSKKESIKKEGLYLITGGSGNLAKKIALHMVKNYQAKVILIGRSLPEKVTYDKELGIEYLQTDVNDQSQLDKVFSEIKNTYPGKKIDGIVHCAGVINDSFIIKKNLADLEQTLEPKVYATELLYQKAVKEGIETLVLFSSIAAIFGNAGQADYAYANSFMNHFSTFVKEGKTKVYSISWPFWEHGGMVGDELAQQQTKKELGLFPITDAKGIEALEAILKNEEAQVIVLYGDEQKMKEKLQVLSESDCLKEGIDMMENKTVIKDASEHNSQRLLEELMGIAAEFVSGCDDAMAIEDDIQDYGFDSVTITAFCNAINERLHIKITPASFFELDEPNIRSLRDFIQSQHMPVRFQEVVENTIKEEQKDDNDISKIAIVGMSALMPQSNSIQEFWNRLIENKELIGEFPKDREVYLKDVTCAKAAGFMKCVDEFDPEFFHMSPREAGNLDPQVRIILELIWKAFEDAGYDPKEYEEKKVGVFLGISSSDYCDLLIKSETKMDASMTLGISNSLRANRISYLYDFRGPSEPIDTACSSSLIAVHHGVEALKSGICDIAIAAGVNVILTPTLFNSFHSAGMLSSEGKCKTFDAKADGYVRGEGAGVVLLKPLKEAQEANDDIYATICATTENHGGHAKSITSPNANAQAQLIYDAYQNAGIDPETVTYIETHGTGTQIGDPVEINGLKKAFQKLFEDNQILAPKRNYCGLGAVKSNIGHLEAASGIAGLIKVVMAMKHHKIPATIHYQELNPYIELDNSPFYIVSKNQEWNRLQREDGTQIPLRAGISAFGYGGSNAHVVLEEYIKEEQPVPKNRTHLFVFSAKTEDSLKEYIKSYCDYLEQGQATNELKELIAQCMAVKPEDIDEIADINEYCDDTVILTILAKKITERYHKEIKVGKLLELGSISKLMDELQLKSEQTVNLDKVEYVLKCGRHHMDIRIAVVAKSSEQLRTYLQGYLNGSLDGIFTKEHESNVVADAQLLSDAKRYVQGEKIDFREAYKDNQPGRTHLPTYCFAKECCWFEREVKELKEKSVNCEKKDVVKSISLTIPKRNEEACEVMSKVTLGTKKVTQAHNDQDCEQVKQEIRQMIADVLYIDLNKVDDNKAFMELGLDSILGVELVRKLKEKYGIDIKATKIYDYSNINQLSKYVAGLMQPEETVIEEEHVIEAVMPSKPVIELKQTTVKSDGVRVDSEQKKSSNWKDIAVIGMSIRFPKSKDLDELWKNLETGKDCVTEIPKERWDSQLFEQDKDMYCKWGGFLDDIDQFDPLFFNLSPADAQVMEPQQRLFLMEVWKALENAGYSKEKLDAKNCGIYAGVMTHSDYCDSMFNAHSMLAARAAYYLNLKGPAVSLDTACSSSLVATHMACKSLIDGDADMMIAGGVTLYLSPKMYKGMGSANMLSHDGKCKTFDDSADGFVPGEGVSVVILKLLDQAIADGDQIYGVIKGCGINQDGRTNGITAPSAMSQTQLECNIYDRYGINPEEIQYVECHGTGTKLGDPIEVEALTDAFRKYTDKKQFCRIGSIKSNFGHTSAASGVGSLIKVLLSMKHGVMPPTLHYETPNTHIDFKNSPFIVNDTLSTWERKNNKKRCAAVSAFGYSGTNAHLVVEEYIKEDKKKEQDGLFLIPLSGRSKQVVEQKVAQLSKWLSNHNKELTIQDLCYTLTQGRSHFDERICFAASGIINLQQQLDAYLNGQKGNTVLIGNVKEHKTAGYMEKQLQKYIIEQLSQPNIDAAAYKDAILALADMYTKGYEIAWTKVYGEKFGQVVAAPTYPFDTKSYWINQTWVAPQVEQRAIENVLCGKPVEGKEGSYAITLTGQEFFLEDNVVYGQKVVPGVAYLEMVKASVEQHKKETVTQIKDLYWLDMIDVNHGAQDVLLKTGLDKGENWFEVTSEHGTKLNAKGKFSCNPELIEEYKDKVIPVNQIITSADSCLEGKECYEGYKNRLFTIGKRLQALEKMYCSGEEAISILKLPQGVAGTDVFKLPPSIMDAVLQTATGLQINMENSPLGKPYLSFCIGEVLFVRELTEKCYAYATLSKNQSNGQVFRSFDVQLLDESGRVLVVIKQFGIKQPLGTWENVQGIKEEKLSDQEIKTLYEKDMIQAIKGLLKMTDETLDPSVELLDYGFSSITLIEFINIINKKYGIDAETAVFFDEDELTAKSLMESLYKKYEKVICQAYGSVKQEEKHLNLKKQENYGNMISESSLNDVYNEVLAAAIEQFKKVDLLKDTSIDVEEIHKIEQFISERYQIPIEACKIQKKSSFADMIKDVVCRNKTLLKNRGIL